VSEIVFDILLIVLIAVVLLLVLSFVLLLITKENPDDETSANQYERIMGRYKEK